MKEKDNKPDLAEQYLDKLLRLQAETENIKKRLAKEKEEFVKFANTGLISEFIGILDDFKRAIDSAEKNHDTKLLLEGVKMIIKHLQEVLKNQGLSTIDETGVAFDHDKHEAVGQVESDEYQENTVVEVLRSGYMINGRVIRPAMVKVSKTKNKNSQGGEAT
jgi:molecular chaperone GrpE